MEMIFSSWKGIVMINEKNVISLAGVRSLAGFLFFFGFIAIIMVTGCSDNGVISENDPTAGIPLASDDYSFDMEYQIKTGAGTVVNFNFGIASFGDNFYAVSASPDSKVYRTSLTTALSGGIFGGPGSGSGQLDSPWDVAIFNDSALFISDSGNSRIQRFTTAGAYIGEFDGSTSGVRLTNPRGIAVSQSGYVFVIDSGLSNVRQFDLDGVHVKDIGAGPGTSDGQLNSPNDVTVDSDGSIYVTDTGNHRVVKYTSAGAFVVKWGSYGTGAGQFISPGGIIADSSGNVFVADSGNGRVQRFDRQGRFLDQIGSYGPGLTNLNFPSGLSVDSLGRLLVVDKGNGRVKRFRKL
ncbi:MAG: hypothetical protein CVV64_02680 [Candidatus Wallbacteria bacterium HGW-Wallbacteria-1]|jgi:hypothetical protein|uniref:6-bladed beta-propeller n=1 Tax=Candidatus Wallbacteria bacterium HGW-Wallbacteria-1 TaxID=2013854 RepID=A0A2N1PTE5_9BACT|nr:MAG: hypothetical protein CVV64_02680 [Candidatus Wallbacteria bacterium HGW-Wallbacteria-1]